MEEALFKVLNDDAAIDAIANSRIYPVVMPQDVKMPAITYHETANSPVNTLQGKSGLENPTWAINCWSTSYDVAKDLAQKVKDAMDAARTFRALLINELDVYDPEVNIYAKAQTYSCWSQE